MRHEASNQEAKDGLQSLGLWMECRYRSRFMTLPIAKWKMPRNERFFFTCYAMNLVLESDGFGGLVEQNAEDITAFARNLQSLGAHKTATLVLDTAQKLNKQLPCAEHNCTEEYYQYFEDEEVWLKLLNYIGRRTYMKYLLRAQRIADSGKSLFDPNEWQGQMPFVWPW